MPTKLNVADYIGKKYNRLTIVSQAPRKDKGNNTRFFVKYDCGKTLTVFYKRLREGNTRSCGCLSKDYHDSRITHGVTKHPLYLVWYHIKERCYNPESKDYHNYGGRGIKVCDEWMDVKIFYEWSICNGWAARIRN
jgi:hypothetical protein